MSSKGLTTVVIAYLFVGCAAEEGDPAQGSSTIESLNRDLSLGSRGEDVRAVNSYLARFGYFANAELQSEYANWRPIVATSPARADVYDAASAQAIQALQRNSGLPQTGMIDAATRGLMKKPRCGVPDGIDLGDGSEKFSLASQGWGTDEITFRVMNTDDGLTISQISSVAQAAFNQWAKPTKHTFRMLSSGTPNIEIWFSPNRKPGVPFGPGASAVATYPINGGDIRFNTAEAWSVTAPPTGGDLAAAMLHEIGHTLGIGHSSIENPPAAMLSWAPVHFLSPDDHVAGLTRVLKWGQFDSATDDVAVQDHFNGQTIFVTGGASIPGGREIWRRDDGIWSLMPRTATGGAVRIAANMDARPWVVDSNRAIFSWNGSSWTRRAGCATDIAIGTDQTVWKIGCNPVAGGFDIAKWNGSGPDASGADSWSPDLTGKGGVRISVGPFGPVDPFCVPWITDNAQKIHRRTTANPGHIGWNLLNGLGTDISVSGSGHAWLISVGATSGGFAIYSFADQSAGTGDPPAPAIHDWIRVTGGGINIATTWWGYPIVANNARGAFEPL